MKMLREFIGDIGRGKSPDAKNIAHDREMTIGVSSDGAALSVEKKQIGAANRDGGIANKQINADGAREKLDDTRREVGGVEQKAAADGKLTPGEQQRINQGRGNVQKLGNELDDLKANDATV